MVFAGKRLMVVYFSPAGSTAHVAQVMQKKIKQLGGHAHLLNLAEHDGNLDSFYASESETNETGFFIGSPVYANHAVTPVLNFISKLPYGMNGFGVPFVTWGGVCSGAALYEMGKALIGNGLRLMGALKVPSVHSLIWDAKSDPGSGHPNSEDDRVVREFVARIVDKASHRHAREVDVSVLNYLPAKGRDPLQNLTYEDVKRNYPDREIRYEVCTQCGICGDDCPVNAISMSPYPEFGRDCVYCYNCVRYCPEKAIKTDLSMLRERIRMRSKDVAEPLTARMWL